VRLSFRVSPANQSIRRTDTGNDCKRQTRAHRSLAARHKTLLFLRFAGFLRLTAGRSKPGYQLLEQLVPELPDDLVEHIKRPDIVRNRTVANDMPGVTAAVTGAPDGAAGARAVDVHGGRSRRSRCCWSRRRLGGRGELGTWSNAGARQGNRRFWEAADCARSDLRF